MGFRVWVVALCIRVQGLGFEVQGLESRVWGLGVIPACRQQLSRSPSRLPVACAKLSLRILSILGDI